MLVLSIVIEILVIGIEQDKTYRVYKCHNELKNPAENVLDVMVTVSIYNINIQKVVSLSIDK